MKKPLIWCVLGLFSMMSAAWSQEKQTGGGVAKAVAALEQQWLRAQKTNNPALLVPLLADKVVITDADGKVSGKTETLETYKKTKWDSVEYNDVKVTVFGDTAIATGGYKGKRTDPSGKPFDENQRWTDTWVKMPNGRWQCVASQTSPVKISNRIGTGS